MSSQEDEWPREGDVLMCTVQKVERFGAFLSLDEYGGKEGFIHISEVSPNWVKNIRDFFREGRKTVAKVLRVDTSKQQVDLSLKRVTEQQKKYKIQEWKQRQKSEKLLEMAAESAGKTVEEANKKVAERLLGKYPDLYTAFEEVVRSGEEVLTDAKVPKSWVKVLHPIITSNIELPTVSIGGEISLQIFEPQGIETLKMALEKIAEPVDGEEKNDLSVKIIGPPKYRVTVTAEDYKTAENIMQKRVEAVKVMLEPHDHTFEFSRIDK